MKAEILYTDVDEQVSIGTFVLKAGKVEIMCPPDTRAAMTRILKEKLRDKSGKRWGVEQGAARWMRLLPMNYDGARMRATLEE
jgi:hypothetical protein